MRSKHQVFSMKAGIWYKRLLGTSMPEFVSYVRSNSDLDFTAELENLSLEQKEYGESLNVEEGARIQQDCYMYNNFCIYPDHRFFEVENYQFAKKLDQEFHERASQWV